MIALLDVNVLVSLAWPNHIFHKSAREWFREQQRFGWATCPTTENGFIRVSSNTGIMPEAKSPREAATFLKKLISLQGHVFWPEEASVMDDRWISLEKIFTYRQITDAHLLALALRNKACLATFDRGIFRLLSEEAKAKGPICLIPTNIG